MGQSQDHTVAERIRRLSAKLTASEHKLAAVILDNYPVSGLGSVSTLAAAANVSTPTTVRMAKKLGFLGFPALQNKLRAELEATYSNPIEKYERSHRKVPTTRGNQHKAKQFGDAIITNLQHTLEQLDTDTFDTVVSLLSDNDRKIYLVGGRLTRSLADYFFTHLQVLRKGVSLIADNANTWPHYALNFEAGDVLLAFDIRRYEQDLLALSQMAKAKEVQVILFTDQWRSPIAQTANQTLTCPIEAPSAWDSSVALMYLVEALISAVQDATWEQTKYRISDLEDLFDTTKMFRKFDKGWITPS